MIAEGAVAKSSDQDDARMTPRMIARMIIQTKPSKQKKQLPKTLVILVYRMIGLKTRMIHPGLGLSSWVQLQACLCVALFDL